MLVTLYRLMLPNGYIEFRIEQHAIDYAASIGLNSPVIIPFTERRRPD